MSIHSIRRKGGLGSKESYLFVKLFLLIRGIGDRGEDTSSHLVPRGVTFPFFCYNKMRKRGMGTYC